MIQLSESAGPSASNLVWFAKSQAVELAATDFANGYILHLRGNKIDRTFYFFAPRSEAILHYGRPLVILPDRSFRLIHDHDLGSGLGHPDHLLDGARLVGKKVDPADVEYAIKGFNLEWQAFCLRLEQVGIALPLEQIALALAQHTPGDVDAVEIDIARQVGEIRARSHRRLQNAGIRFQLKITDEIQPVVRFSGEPVIKAFGQVVARSDAVVECLIFQIRPGNGAHKERNAVANRVNAPGRRIAQVSACHLKRIARVRVAKQR
jgi:hypothetical protein